MSLSLYPIRYLRDFFVPYDSFLETNMLLTSMSSILYMYIYIFVFVEGAFSDFFVVKIYALLTHSYILQIKKTTNFYIDNLGIHRVIMFLPCD